MTTLDSSWRTLSYKEYYASGYLALRLNLQARLNEQKTASNQSVIDTRIYAEILNSADYTYYSYTFRCSYAADKSASSTSVIHLNSTRVLIQGRGTVTHDSSGAYSGSISGSVELSSGLSSSLSSTFDLPTIQQSTPAPSSAVIAGYENGPTVATGETVYVNWIAVTGSNSYDIEVTQPDGSWGGTKNVTVGNQPVTISGDYKAGTVIEARIRANMNGVSSPWTITSNNVTVSGGVWFKKSNSWKNGNVWVKKSNTWIRAKRVWIKANGEWKVGA